MVVRRSEKKKDELEGFVYRVPGPDGVEHRWIARSVHGHVAHGKTPSDAARNLFLGMQALADAAGQPFPQWRRSQTRDARFLRAGELVQA
jgi:hypothetical protein